MPAKNSKLKYGNRDYIFDVKFHKTFVKETGVDLSYKDMKQILNVHLENIAEIVEDEIDGFKMPSGLGYLCAVKYVPKKLPIDWKRTNALGKMVYFNNLATGGHTATAKHFRVGRPNNNAFYDVFMFKPTKTLRRGIIKKFKAGKSYVDFTISDFLEKSRLTNLYSKRYSKEIKK